VGWILFAMQKTKAFWLHLLLYFILNAGAFYFYSLAGQPAVVRWLLSLVILFSFLLIAAHFYAYSKKNTRLTATLEEYCRKVEVELKKELEAGQKKTQFIRNAYHEVRGQFWGVFVISRILAIGGQKGLTANTEKMLGDLSNGCHNLQLLLSNILDYAKHESGIPENPNYEAIDFRRNLVELIDIARYAAYEKNIRIESFVSDEIPEYVACDRIMINQVMTNLINNAIKFSNPGGTIVVFLHKDNTRLRISIKDQGRGIPTTLLPHIFDLFFTTKNRNRLGEGLGLGLYITRQLVAALKGEIDVQSEENAGSCFIVSLPIIPFEALSEINCCPSSEAI
jgi:signal transduction histidine kinase